MHQGNKEGYVYSLRESCCPSEAKSTIAQVRTAYYIHECNICVNLSKSAAKPEIWFLNFFRAHQPDLVKLVKFCTFWESKSSQYDNLGQNDGHLKIRRIFIFKITFYQCNFWYRATVLQNRFSTKRKDTCLIKFYVEYDLRVSKKSKTSIFLARWIHLEWTSYK